MEDIVLPRQSWAHAQGWRSTVIGALACAVVAAAAAFAFAPRELPDFPATENDMSQILVNGVLTSGENVIAVGELGEIRITGDGGENWTVADVVPKRGSTLTNAAYLDKGVAVAVGHDLWMLRTEDDGRTWQELSYSEEFSEPMLGIHVTATGRAFAFGSFGRVMVSDDRGKTWTMKDVGAGDWHYYAMASDDRGHIMLVGEQGLVVRSKDNGETWSKVEPFYPGSFFGVLKLENAWLAYGLRGRLFRSADGENWTELESPIPVSLFDGVVLRSGRVLLVGQGGTVLSSINDGRTFSVLQSGGLHSLTSVTELSPGVVLVGGENGITKLNMQ